MVKLLKKALVIPKPVTEYDLRLLRIFKTVVENGGFSSAENDLGITRSTISVHMSNLESRMKLKLCQRGRGGFSLTEAGQEVYHGTIRLFDSLGDFALMVSSLSKEISGELVILCSDQLNLEKQKQLAEVVKYVHDHSPKLHLTLDGESIRNIEQSLLRDKAHIGIFPGYHQVQGLHYEQVLSEPMSLCCSQNHPFFKLSDPQIGEEELLQAQTIHPGIDIDTTGREQLKKLSLCAKAYQFDTRKIMILSGRYIGYLPQSYIKQELNNGEMRIIHENTMSYEFALSIVYKIAPREVNKIELLRQAFAAVFNNTSATN
jgi:DNA-binding transcriptional LysR family regulator